jgi:hypothetical protein
MRRILVQRRKMKIVKYRNHRCNSIKHEKQIKDLTVNITLVFDLQMSNKFMSNNCKSEGFEIQISEDDLSRVSVESITIFTQSSWVFA